MKNHIVDTLTNGVRNDIRNLLIRHEGLKLKPYRCTSGKLTIGVGRNLDDKGITLEEAMTLLEHDLNEVWRQCYNSFLWMHSLDEVRRCVVVDMVFNLGIGGFKKFKQTIACLDSGQYEQAAQQMLASKWATQVKGRAKTLAQMMRTGKWPSE